MKLRIKDNSVRFRLTQSEVAQLAEQGIVTSTTQFIDKSLVYAVEMTNEEELSANFTENKVALNMPKVMVNELVNSDRVGFDGQSGKVKLLIEKDFVCLDNSVEDQSDNYPHPTLKC
ncbi:MAG: hypothetical protein J7577_00565 [Sphingobacteriaceae bacterium]|nr:hypothetical protein [Sphingobacteriaceae bacterium]